MRWSIYLKLSYLSIYLSIYSICNLARKKGRNRRPAGRALTSGLGDKLYCNVSMAQRRHSCATKITGRCDINEHPSILRSRISGSDSAGRKGVQSRTFANIFTEHIEQVLWHQKQTQEFVASFDLHFFSSPPPNSWQPRHHTRHWKRNIFSSMC